MTKTMMELGGATRAEADIVVADSRTAEVYVAQAYDGSLMEPYDPVGDVEVPGRHCIYDVKTVPSIFAKFVNGGDKRPLVDSIVACRGPWLILGLIRREQWVYGIPRVPGRKAQPCFYVLMKDVLPAPPRRKVIGYDDPAIYEMTWDELLHVDWNDRDRRRRERRANRPIVLPGVGEDDGKGTGLAGRRSHAPGKENWKRKRGSEPEPEAVQEGPGLWTKTP